MAHYITTAGYTNVQIKRVVGWLTDH